MNCRDARSVIDATVGLSVPAADVGIEPAEARACRDHLRGCADCAALAGDLGDVAASLTGALADLGGSSGDDERLAAAVAADLARERPLGRFLRSGAFQRAAAVFLTAISMGALWRAARDAAPEGPDGNRGYGVASMDRAPVEEGPDGPGLVADHRGPHLVDVTPRTGLDVVDHTGLPMEKDWMVETVGHGAAVLDMDGDGDMDLFVPDGNRFPPAPPVDGTWRLYRNEGGLRFTDVTGDSGLDRSDWACGVVAGDVDGDGRPDLFVACFGQNLLFRNLGDGRFEDVTTRAGVGGLTEEWSSAAALGDVDGDGDLDLFVANYANMREFMDRTEQGRGCTWRRMKVACGPLPLPPQADRLYLNHGDGTFEDVTDERTPGRISYSFQPVIADLNGDGANDVFVAADAHPNQLLLNDGSGFFTEDAFAARVAGDGMGREQACMGVAPGDVDGDGALDLFVTNFSHEFNVLYRHRGSTGGVPEFADATGGAGLAEAGLYTLGWGTSLVDLDSDGDLDLAAANGHLYPGVEDVARMTSYAQHMSVYRNDGSGRYVEISRSAGVDVVRRRVHRALIAADFDDDGHQDLFVTVLNGRALLLRSDGAGCGRSIRLVLRSRSGVEAAGAVVVARVRDGQDERTVTGHLVLGSSFASSEDPRVHLGLGGAERVESLEVRWPFGDVQAFGPLDAGGVYELREGVDSAVRLR